MIAAHADALEAARAIRSRLQVSAQGGSAEIVAARVTNLLAAPLACAEAAGDVEAMESIRQAAELMNALAGRK